MAAVVVPVEVEEELIGRSPEIQDGVVAAMPAEEEEEGDGGSSVKEGEVAEMESEYPETGAENGMREVASSVPENRDVHGEEEHSLVGHCAHNSFADYTVAQTM